MDENVPGFLGWLETGAGKVPRVSPVLGFQDRMGGWKARWGIGRMSYLVPPGLYAVGSPAPQDPVLVTANYKMSYDLLRRALAGRNAWILVLETFGINVWCAAGKGTFGTGELVRRVRAAGLDRVVAHRRLLLPLLGAPGVAAHEVARRTGFTVRYAALRAGDLPAFLDAGQVATPAMGELTFTFRDRLVLIPVELVSALRGLALAGIGLFLLTSFLGGGGARGGLKVLMAFLGAALAGIVAGPLLLPWLPGRSFAFKGGLAGLAWTLAWFLLAGGQAWKGSTTLAAFLALPAVSAYFTLKFTGSTPFTSKSGVKKEMKYALPAMAFLVLAGGAALLTGLVW